MQLIFLLLFLVLAVLFIFTQQNILKVIRSENRELNPGQVWLQLIPLFNLYWQFVVVTRIADSISRQNASFQDDSILGIPDYDAVEAIGKRPTYKIGMAYCILFIANTILSYISDLKAFQGVIALGALTCWIIYWGQLLENKKKIQKLQRVADTGF